MVIFAWMLSVLLACWLGYKLSALQAAIEALQATLRRRPESVEPQQPISTLIDPDDPISQAVWERERMMKKLNGK